MNMIRAMCGSESEYKGFKWGFISLPFVIILGLIIAIMLVCASSGGTFTLDLSNTVEFLAGGITSLAVHEGGHWATLEYYGRDYKFYFDGVNPTFDYEGDPNNAIQMSGLAAQMIVGESVALLTRKKRRHFWRGYLFFGGLNEIAYPLLKYNRGDFKYMKGREKTIFAAISIAHGCLNIFRLYRDDQLNVTSWIGTSRRGTPMGGFRIQW